MIKRMIFFVFLQFFGIKQHENDGFLDIFIRILIFWRFFSFFPIFYLFSWEFGVLAAMLSRLATACRRC